MLRATYRTERRCALAGRTMAHAACTSHSSKFIHMSQHAVASCDCIMSPATTNYEGPGPTRVVPEKKLHSLFSQFPSTRSTALYSPSKPGDEPWEGRNASLVCNNMPYLPFL